ncbi:unnamed protein product [Pleuronectes platessa]|uniref:Uncharacterized protein n=1 Tax=Pleuronectes platessa TaxID=8262 RepID=A0A9N7VJI4_PLEPL|nr:unnamed protein product [Pleuronectes platessa]
MLILILLPSGRRYRSIRARTTRLRDSFIPQAIRLLNSSPRLGADISPPLETEAQGESVASLTDEEPSRRKTTALTEGSGGELRCNTRSTLEKYKPKRVRRCSCVAFRGQWSGLKANVCFCVLTDTDR